MGSVGMYEKPGKCSTCTIYGCPDRECDNEKWRDDKLSDHLDYDEQKRFEDKDNPLDDFANIKRRGRIERCQRKRENEEPVIIDENGDRWHEVKKKRTEIVNEYLVTVQFHYDNWPSMKHQKVETVYAVGYMEAERQALAMYPNSVMLDLKMGTEQNIEREVEP